jgi:hypothetical protein
MLMKYDSLQNRGRSGKKFLSQLRFGMTAVDDCNKTRQKFSESMNRLQLVLNLTNVESQGRIEQEQHMETHEAELRAIQKSLRKLVATDAASLSDAASFNTWASNDKKIWQKVRDDLASKGVRFNIIEENKDAIIAYVEELGEKECRMILGTKTDKIRVKKGIQTPESIGRISGVEDMLIDGRQTIIIRSLALHLHARNVHRRAKDAIHHLTGQ